MNRWRPTSWSIITPLSIYNSPFGWSYWLFSRFWSRGWVGVHQVWILDFRWWGFKLLFLPPLAGTHILPQKYTAIDTMQQNMSSVASPGKSEVHVRTPDLNPTFSFIVL
jgi:hypothetical protein